MNERLMQSNEHGQLLKYGQYFIHPFSLQMMFIDYINPLQFLVNVGALFC